MATIGKIRKHSTLLLIMVGGALALFVLSDFFGSSGGQRPKQFELAVVSGKKIPANDFYIKLDEQIEMYRLQYGENLDARTLFQIREEVFNELIRQNILQAQFEKIGLSVSLSEMADMMTGVNIHPIIRQNFVDPQTGIFNPVFVQNYIQNLESLEPQQQKQWYTLERIMKEERYFEKYKTLVSKSYFVPSAMAESLYKKQNASAVVRVLSINYSTIPDEDITLTDKDFEKFYKARKHEFEQEASRWLEYVIFDVLPGKDDIAAGEVVVEKIYEEFKEIPHDSIKENFIFADLKSDLDFNADTGFIKRVMLPAQADTLFDMPVGSFVGPYEENNAYFIFRLLAKENRADSMKASHILIPFRGAFRAETDITITKEEAEAKADSLLALVKGKDSVVFAQFAMEFSSDMTANMSGGSLNWFTDGTMVPEFNEACQNARPGEFFVVETVFGFHVIHLTGKKAFEPKAKIAMLKYTIEPSSETTQQVYTEASKLAGDNKTTEDFHKYVEEKGYILRTSEFTRTSDYSIPGIMEGREIVRWSFDDDIKTGTISPVFEMIGESRNVVVLVRQVRNKGIAPLEDIKEMIEPLVKREKKFEILSEKVNQAKSGATSIEDIAKKLNVQVQQLEFINFGSPNLPGIGPEPKVVGTIFGTEKGKISRTVKGDMGVYVVQTVEITDAPPTDDYSIITFNQRGFFKNRVNFEVYNALLKKADVRDNKIRFY